MAATSGNAKNPHKLAEDTAHEPAYNREEHGGLDTVVFDFHKNANAAFTLAPAEGKQLVSLLTDNHAEEKGFPSV